LPSPIPVSLSTKVFTNIGAFTSNLDLAIHGPLVGVTVEF